ncbi:MAG: ribosome maturation factor RimP [Candidatus Eremiobacterales bacterium]|jgi:ribosome maturation factor RimP
MRAQLEEIAASVPGAFGGVEVLRTLLRREGRTQVMSLTVDREGGMDTDACGRISRYVINRIEALDPPIEDYRVEVASAGLERPLLTAEHYRRFRGRPAKVVTSLHIGNRVEFNGPIDVVTDEAVTIRDPHAGPTPIPFAAIKRAHLIYDPSTDLKKKR